MELWSRQFSMRQLQAGAAERIATAETIIGARRHALIGNPSASDEREALQDALKGLRNPATKPDLAVRWTSPVFGGPFRSANASYLRGKTMPRWVALCLGCKKAFTHSRIALAFLQSPDQFPARKPVLPQNGEKKICPKCRRVVLVRSCDLCYSFIS